MIIRYYERSYLHDDISQDRILVACFNPSIFKSEYHRKGLYSFEDIYKFN